MPSTKSPFLLRKLSPAPVAGALQQVPLVPGHVGQARLEGILEVDPLGRAVGALLGAGLLAGLERDQPLLQRAEFAAHLVAELVQRRALARRVEQPRELRCVAIEVALQLRGQPAERTLATVRVEQLADQPAQLAVLAQELLERARQAPVTIGEVRPELLLDSLGGARIRLLQPLAEAAELGAHDIRRQAHACAADGLQADARRALDQLRLLRRLALGDEGGQLLVDELEMLHDDAVGGDGNAALHTGNIGTGCDSSCVALWRVNR